MTFSTGAVPDNVREADRLSDKFIACLKAQADALGKGFPNLSPMEAHAMALILVDTLVKLHEYSNIDDYHCNHENDSTS